MIRNDTSIQAVAVGNCFYVTAYESQVVNLQKDLQVDLQTPGIYMFRLHNGMLVIKLPIRHTSNIPCLSK